jgi:enoyl-CoA hydratase
MSFDNLLIERDDAIGVVTLNRPTVLNALDDRTLDELERALIDMQRADDIRVLIVTGAGDKAFVAGADLAEFAALGPADAQAFARRGQRVFARIERLGKPVIAAVNGFALGGGCELAMACTFRVAADHARFGQPEVQLGVMPGFGGTVRLPRLVGVGRALDLLLTGRRVDAAEALQMGLVQRVVPAATLMDEAKALARHLAAQPPFAVRSIIDAVLRGCAMAPDEAAAFEATAFGLTFATDDAREGAAAFLEKRKPAFTGR